MKGSSSSGGGVLGSVLGWVERHGYDYPASGANSGLAGRPPAPAAHRRAKRGDISQSRPETPAVSVSLRQPSDLTCSTSTKLQQLQHLQQTLLTQQPCSGTQHSSTFFRSFHIQKPFTRPALSAFQKCQPSSSPSSFNLLRGLQTPLFSFLQRWFSFVIMLN